jgi:23S rRNA (uracil1939-C5)-methyltransferase
VAFDVVVLDPPRAGAPGILPRLVRNRPRRIIYVTCHAGNAARDVREITKHGYRLVEVIGFDLFPRTHHLEAMLILDR